MEAALRWAVRESPLRMAHNRPVVDKINRRRVLRRSRRRKRVRVLAACPSSVAYSRFIILPSLGRTCHFELK